MFALEGRFLKFIFVITIAVLCGNSSIDAGDWHGPNQLDCSECHTVHYRERGIAPLTAEGGGPFPKLLIASTVNALCLMCHDGTDTEAPDVVAPLDSVGYTDNPAGGFFANSGGSASDNAHNLGMSSAETPPGSPDSLILDCVSCHGPHGSSNYRNLLLNPAGSGNASDVNLVISQTVQADGPGGVAPNQVFIPSNITYQSGMSDWCNDCHTDFHGSGETGSPEPWFRHPIDQTISASTFVDYTYWSGTVTNHVQVDNPSDLIIPSADDEVFCLSCHKAHGSPNKHSLIYADGSTKRSTCLQCHYGPYDSTEHGNTGTGVFRIGAEPQGDCAQCHDLHASREGVATPGGPHDYGLFASNDNNLCYDCHSLAGSNNIYQGSAAYGGSIHGTDANVYWPGPNPPSKSPSDYGKCVNCHTPHGYDDGSGLVPSQAFAREETLCESCHDGSPSVIDIQFEMNKTYGHPTSSYSARHDPSESGPSAFDNFNRHAE